MLVSLGLADDEDRGLPQTCLTQATSQVRLDLVGLRRHPVEHDRHRDVPGSGLTQVVPGHGVGVAGRGGDEDPQVGAGQQGGGQRPVVVGHGVDVRGVQQREAWDQPVRLPQLQLAGRHRGRRGGRGLCLHAYTGQGAEHPVSLEPVPLTRGVKEHGPACGGTDRGGGDDRPPDEGGDEGGLARTRRASDDGEHRGVQGLQPGQDVVRELIGHLPGTLGRVLPRRQLVGQLDRRQPGPQLLDSPDQRLSHRVPAAGDAGPPGRPGPRYGRRPGPAHRSGCP